MAPGGYSQSCDFRCGFCDKCGHCVTRILSAVYTLVLIHTHSRICLCRSDIRHFLRMDTIRRAALRIASFGKIYYASTVWDPHTQKNIHKLDMIQRRAARYGGNRWHNTSSVTEMVSHLGWEPLTTQRRNMRLCMMYKIAHTVVGDPWTEWLTTTKRVTRGFHAWKYIPIYSQHNIYKF